jgi:membrane dipeptidase
VAHAIEGGHALGRYKPRSKKRKLSDLESSKLQNPNSLERLYISHLEEFKARGVCMMTLSHFFENDISFPVEGISPDQKKKLGMEWNYDPWVDNKPLPDLGITVVKKMLDIGIIVDVAHTTPNVRSDVFKINDERAIKRPIVFSHVGAQGVFEKYNKNPDYDNYKYYCVSDPEILKIKECGGIIGVIPEVFWLTGCNDHLKGCGNKFRNGIDYIIETIEYIHKVSGTYDNIGIGTDFDGLACAPIDLYKASQLKNLINAMEKSGISKEDINKILYKNTQRVLKNGWV